MSPFLFLFGFVVLVFVFHWVSNRGHGHGHSHSNSKSKIAKVRLPTPATEGPLRISSITIYPIKSCGGISLKRWVYNRNGFKYDRSFMLINQETGQHLSQREYPRMSLIQPEMDEAKNTLTLRVSDSTDADDILTIPLVPPTDSNQLEERKVKVFDDEMTARVFTSAHIGKWFARALKLPDRRTVSLASLLGSDAHSRPFQKAYDRTPKDQRIQPPFSDQAPFLLTTTASLEKLNGWTDYEDGRDVPMKAFRPNLVVDGEMLPFEEDLWRKISIRHSKASTSSSSSSSTSQTFWCAKACARCIETTVDFNKGRFHPSGEPLLSLREHRKIMPEIPSEADSAVFGQLLMQEQEEGVIEVGDLVDILGRKSHPYDPVEQQIPEQDLDAWKSIGQKN